MKIKYHGSIGLSLGYCSGDYCKNFSKFEKIKEENLEKNLKNFISYIRK